MALRAPALPRPTTTRRIIRPLGLVLALGALAVCLLLSVTVGAKPIPVAEVWAALSDYDGSYDHDVIRTLRLPRTIIGVFVGAALGLAGALMQALTRNPLAEPGILGVNSGAAAAVVVASLVFGATGAAYVWPAFIGAALASCAVYALGSRGRAGATPVRLALAGTALSAVLQGLIHGVFVFDTFVFDRVRFWQVGSLTGRDLDVFWQVAPFLVAGVALTLCLGPSLNAVALGDDLAATLGTNVPLVRAVTAVSVILLCGSATAAAGPLWFVGLVVPHMARLITGPDQRWLLPYSALSGAVLLTAAIVYLLAMKNGVQGYRLVLVGIGVAAMLGAVRDYLMTRSDLTDAMGAQIWMIGSLHGRGWGEVAAVWIGLALLGPLLSALGGRLRLMELGEDTARGLGVPTRSTQLVALAGASALTGAAIAVAGPIGFVALAAPQLAGRLARTGTTLAGSALMGATLLVIADLVALRALAPVQLPVGVVTAVIGGGYLIWLLYIEWRGQRA